MNGWTRARAWAVGLLACAVLASGPAGDARAQEDVSSSARAQLLLRSLGYDRTIKDRAKAGRVVVAVLFRQGSSASVDCERETVDALSEAGKAITVAGLPVSAVPLPYPKGGDLAAELRRVGAQAVYACSGLDAEVSHIATATRASSVLSFAPTEDYVRGGIGIGIVARGGHAVMLVNMSAVQAEGSQLDSGLLRVSERVR